MSNFLRQLFRSGSKPSTQSVRSADRDSEGIHPEITEFRYKRNLVVIYVAVMRSCRNFGIDTFGQSRCLRCEVDLYRLY